MRTPPKYVVPNHSHTSDEVYVWLKRGDLPMSPPTARGRGWNAPAYISLPGQSPRRLNAGMSKCVFYLRYGRPFNIPVPRDARAQVNSMAVGTTAPGVMRDPAEALLFRTGLTFRRRQPHGGSSGTHASRVPLPASRRPSANWDRGGQKLSTEIPPSAPCSTVAESRTANSLDGADRVAALAGSI